ncbi:hypothetical protein Hypma_001142 [Hypsizygus marmoreus]|uniref:Uncharacterized protein n=1 Tax=Hypsizygus marmoreus TaxID=39966 RepID=A0A369JDS2_HYPMA|nr:hypothetical protein Hypma_001142 [Hypsizygus marmoreus]
MANRVSIDDEDSRIQYSVGQWKLTDGKPDEFHNTSHRTRKGGATATLIFNGSAVDVYGTLPNAQPADTVASFTIDGINFATITLPRSPVVAYRQLLFTASNLDDGQHTLIVTCVADGGPLQLDYFDVISSILTTSPSTTSLHQPTPITTLQSSTRLTLTASAVHTVRPWSSPDAVSSSVGPSNPLTLIPSTSSSATDSPETNPDSPKPNPGTNNPSTASRAEKPVGMIIGGAVGGVAALAVAVFFCGYYYRRRRARCHAVQYSPPSPFRALGRPQSEAITKARRMGVFASRSDLDLQGPQPPSASNDSRYVTPSGIPIEKSTRRTRGKKYRGTDSINTGTSDIPREDEPPPYGHLETSASDSGSVLCLV